LAAQTPGGLTDTFTVRATDASGAAATMNVSVTIASGAIDPIGVSYGAGSSTTSIANGVVTASLSAPAGKLGLIGTDADSLVAVRSGIYGPNWKAWFDGTSGAAPYPTSSFGVDFWVSGSQNVEFQTANANGTPSYIQLWVDDRMVNIPMQPPWAANTTNTLKINLGDTGLHRVRLMTSSTGIGAVWTGPNGVIIAADPAGPRLFVLGDSMTEGYGYNTGGELGTWLPQFARAVGIHDYWNGGRGGTGFVRTNGLTPNFITRAGTEVVPSHADIVIVGSWWNDKAAGRTSSEIAAAVGSVLATISAMPNQPYVIVLGAPDVAAGVNGQDFLAIEAAVKPVVRSYGAAFVSPINGAVIDGAGNTLAVDGPWFTAQNRAAYINPFDNLHANDAGHSYIAMRMEQAYRVLSAAGQAGSLVG
jgi:hypothetical protein